MAINPKRKILLVGGGGHCRSVVDSIISLGTYDDIGIVDDNTNASVLDIHVVGTDTDIPNLFLSGWTDAFITVGSIGNTSVRRRLYGLVKSVGMCVPSVIDPSAIISVGTEISEGVYVGKRAIINNGSKVGLCSIINSGAIIEHDCLVGDFVHVSPGTIMCGQVKIGNDSHIGAGSVIRQQINIGNNVLVGAGSVVVRDIIDGKMAYGNPCKVVEK